MPPPQAAVSTERDAVFKARGAAGPAAPPGRCQLLSLSLSLSLPMPLLEWWQPHAGGVHLLSERASPPYATALRGLFHTRGTWTSRF